MLLMGNSYYTLHSHIDNTITIEPPAGHLHMPNTAESGKLNPTDMEMAGAIT